MKVVDPGHVYFLDTLDEDILDEYDFELRFVKRTGDKYPGNEGRGHQGTTTQDVMRCLIDRTLYVNKQEPHRANGEVLKGLRDGLLALELRAAQRRGDVPELLVKLNAALEAGTFIETIPVCTKCGHIGCTQHPVKT